MMLESRQNNRISGAKIAAELGISQATVSRALNGNKRISQAMRKQVQETAQRLGYVANATARTLVKGRSNLVGILTGGLQVEGTANLLISLDIQLRKHGLLPYLLYTRSETDRIADGARHLLEQGVDALIIIGLCPSSIKKLQEQALLQIKPTIFINDSLSEDRINLIASDFTDAYEKVCENLKNQGRRNIFALWETAIDESSSNPIVYTRFSAVKSLLHQFNQEEHLISLSHTVGPNALYNNQDLNRDFRNKINTFVCDHPECDAIICFDDNLAFSTLATLNHHGRKVPSDLALVGYCNHQLGERMEPALSTIDPQPNDIASATVNRLLELISNPQDQVRTIKVPAKFTQRETL